MRVPVEKSRHATNAGAIAQAQALAAANPGRVFRARRGNRILWESN